MKRRKGTKTTKVLETDVLGRLWCLRVSKLCSILPFPNLPRSVMP